MSVQRSVRPWIAPASANHLYAIALVALLGAMISVIAGSWPARPAPCAMTSDQFKAVRLGMTKSDLTRLTGCDGEVYSRWRSATSEAVSMIYPDHHGGLFIVILEGGLVRLVAATPR